MQIKNKALALTLLCGGTIITSTAYSQILGGLPVIDVTHIGQTILNKVELVKQVAEAVKTVERLTATYNHIKYQAQMIAGKKIWQTPTILWRGVSALDTTGNNTPWLAAINSGANTVEAWEKATMTRVNSGIILNATPSRWRDQKAKEIAALELEDGTAIGAMNTIGATRASGVQVERVIQSLENATLSDLDDQNTEAAQLNKANVLSTLQIKAMQDHNRLLVVQSELALLRLKKERDAAALASVSEAAFRTQGKQNADAAWSGMADAMLAYRLP